MTTSTRFPAAARALALVVASGGLLVLSPSARADSRPSPSAQAAAQPTPAPSASAAATGRSTTPDDARDAEFRAHHRRRHHARNVPAQPPRVEPARGVPEPRGFTLPTDAGRIR